MNMYLNIDYESNFEGEPTGLNNPELLKMKWHHGHNNSIVNGIPRIGFMKGGQAAKWIDEDMADHFLEKVKEYVKVKRNQPFFLFYTMQQPHVPRTPHPRFAGKSGLGPRGDVIIEADWVIGEFVRTLDEQGILENTLIILSSDNGPVLNDGYYDDADILNGMHTPAGNLRGGKYSLFDAGTRVPFISYWKGHIKPKVSDALICQIDLLNSIAGLTGSTAKSNDGLNMMPALLGKSNKGRKNLIIEANFKTALRHKNWAMIPPYHGEKINSKVNIELGIDSGYQLFDLAKDPGQLTNLASLNPKMLQKLKSIFYKLRSENNTAQVQELELK